MQSTVKMQISTTKNRVTYDNNLDLHVFITESQNRIVEIRESIDKMTHQNKNADLDQKKIFRMKKFFN